MGCCSVNGLSERFGKREVRGELKGYLKRGLDEPERVSVRALKERGIAGASLLEVGGGVGSLHLELIKEGAAGAVGYEVSPASIDGAKDLAERMGLRDSVEYHLGDFVDLAPQAEPADIVLLNKVVCCYPNMPSLMAASGGRANRLCGLVYPRRTWWSRAGVRLANLFLAATRQRFRIFVHRPEELSATLASQGLVSVFRRGTYFLNFWQVELFERRSA